MAESKRKFKKKKKKDKTEVSAVSRSFSQVKESAKKFNFKLALTEIGLFVLMFGTLEFCNFNSDKSPVFFYAFTVFYGALFLLAGAFIIVNRGFSRDVPTRDQLSDDMSDGEKDKFIEKLEKGHRAGKKILIFLVPLLFTVLIDWILTNFTGFGG